MLAHVWYVAASRVGVPVSIASGTVCSGCLRLSLDSEPLSISTARLSCTFTEVNVFERAFAVDVVEEKA